MKNYVLGFCFSRDYSKVVLIKKTRPAWQSGRLNGVGGHIERAETPLDAMIREFAEETNYPHATNWTYFGVLQGKDWVVHLFHGQYGVIPGPYNTSEEGEVSVHYVTCVLNKPTSKGSPPLPNLRYLIPMAINHATGVDAAPFFTIQEGSCASDNG